MTLPPEITKAARTLLGWNQKRLSAESGVYLGSISRHESGAGIRPHNVVKIIDAFEEAGLEFLFKDEKIIGFARKVEF